MPAEPDRTLPRRRRGSVGILVHNVDATGGMERQAVLLAREIARQGRRVVLVSSFFPKRGLGLGWGNPPLRERRAGVLVYRIPFFTNLLWNYLASLSLYETLAAWLFHEHGVAVLYGVQGQTGGVHAARLAPVLELPSVTKLACSGALGDIAMAPEAPQGRSVYERLRELDRVVYLNEESRVEALSVGVASDRLVAVPNGIDLARFPRDLAPALLPELGDRASERELVLFVGRLDRQKRASILLEAFARVAARRPRARLAIAGQGPLLGELQQQARALGLDGKAFFLGVRPDVPALLRAASVFALPSAHEGQSNALLEALAAGTPAVASDIPGNRCLVEHDRDALLVPVDDALALERALERLLEDRALASRLAVAGRARVEASYSIESVARRYVALFDSLPRRPRASSARFALRYAFSRLWGISGVLGYVAFTSIKCAITIAVVALKRALGIEGDILHRS